MLAAFIVFAFAMIIAIVIYFYIHGYYRAATHVAFASVGVLSLFGTDGWRSYLIVLGFVLVTNIALGAFLFGNYIGYEYSRFDLYEYVLTLRGGAQIRVKLFRSGERGVLVQKKDDHFLSFIAKDSIVEISSVANPN